MSIVLLDVNVLIALAWPSHIHHESAHRWFSAIRSSGWATCPLTQSGFVRVSANTRVFPDSVTPQEALTLLADIVTVDGHHFWSDTVNLSSSEYIEPNKILGFRQVTDAHLIAIALSHHGRIASFDKGLASLVPSGYKARKVTELIRVV